MSDVTDAPTREATSATSAGAVQGSHIWYELMTPDPEGAKAFYDAVVGWNIGEPMPEAGGYRMIGRSDGKFAGGVTPHDHFPGPTWIGYIGVDDLDATVASIEEKGGKILREAWEIPNVGRMAIVADPQGAFFYLMKPTPPAEDPNAQSDVFSPTAEQRVSWNELSTSDPTAARRFYGEQFGWTTDESMDTPMGEYRFIDHRRARIGAISGLMPGLDFQGNGGCQSEGRDDCFRTGASSVGRSRRNRH
jgi:uncharacterized protein